MIHIYNNIEKKISIIPTNQYLLIRINITDFYKTKGGIHDFYKIKKPKGTIHDF